MKVLSVSTNELEGGAARAANRLHQGLLAANVDAHMMVQSKSTSDSRVLGVEGKFIRGFNALRPTLDQLPAFIFTPTGMTGFASQWFPDRIPSTVARLKPDIVHLHWICKGFVQIGSLSKLRQPIVWTLHDMWPMTGGCYHSGDCHRFQNRCGKCPILNSHREHDLSRWVMNRKIRAWKNSAITIACPSRWMAERASKSRLFAQHRIEVIANGLDLHRYQPVDRPTARSWLGLAQNKKLVLFSAVRGRQNPYKGFSILKDLAVHLGELGWKDRLEFVFMGEVEPEDISGLPLHAHRLGHLHDDASISLVYGAVDALVSPSLQDNLPNTIMEALACGTPCAAFQVGGIPEMITHELNGYLAASGDTYNLAIGVDWILKDTERWHRLSLSARGKAMKDYDFIHQSQKYIELYTELITTPGR